MVALMAVIAHATAQDLDEKTLYLIAPDGRVALATVMMDKVEAELAKALGD